MNLKYPADTQTHRPVLIDLRQGLVVSAETGPVHEKSSVRDAGEFLFETVL